MLEADVYLFLKMRPMKYDTFKDMTSIKFNKASEMSFDCCSIASLDTFIIQVYVGHSIYSLYSHSNCIWNNFFEIQKNNDEKLISSACCKNPRNDYPIILI